MPGRFPDAGRQTEMINVAMGNDDAFDFGEANSRALEPLRDHLQHAGKLGTGIDQRDWAAAQGIKIGGYEVGIVGELQANGSREVLVPPPPSDE